jgi:uncharacterized protein YjbI with pentapeptide repeats
LKASVPAGVRARDDGGRDDVIEALTRHSTVFLLASRAVRKPDVRVSRRMPFLRLLVQGVTRTMRPFRQHVHRRGVLIARLDAAHLDHYDLAGADLSSFRIDAADLRRAHLRDSDLTNASLYRTDLEAADLTGSRLRRADLREANLSGARLVRADLRGAHLDGALLRSADLRGADLRGANLTAADLRRAQLDDDFDAATVVSDRATQWPVPPQPDAP